MRGGDAGLDRRGIRLERKVLPCGGARTHARANTRLALTLTEAEALIQTQAETEAET